MKKFLNIIKTILIIISILIIIVGISTLCVAGFEKSIEYKAGTRIEVYIPQGYEKEDIINIAKECFETDEVLLSKLDNINKVAGIKVTEYSKEQLDTYINKIVEKYDIDEEEREVKEVIIPETKISTVVKPYILPILFITCASLIYIIIRNFKNNKGIKIPLRILGILVIFLGLYFSIIGLFRLPFGIYTMPLAFAIYIVALLITANKRCE